MFERDINQKIEALEITDEFLEKGADLILEREHDSARLRRIASDYRQAGMNNLAVLCERAAAKLESGAE